MIAREEMPKKSLCRKGNYYRSEQVNIKSIRYCKCTSVLYILVKSPHIGGNLIKVSKVLKKKYTFLLIGQNFIGIFFIYNDIVNHDINSRKFFAGVR